MKWLIVGSLLVVALATVFLVRRWNARKRISAIWDRVFKERPKEMEEMSKRIAAIDPEERSAQVAANWERLRATRERRIAAVKHRRATVAAARAADREGNTI